MLLCLWVILMLFSSFGSTAEAIGQQYRTSLRRQFNWMIVKQPYYRMDVRIKPDADIGEGVDCSRYIYLVYRWAGVPGIRRTTSDRMALGLDGWTGKDVTLDKADDLDLVWWTFKPTRKNGHVGSLLRDEKTGILDVTHSSSSRGVVLDQFKGWAIEKLTKIRRITIGE